ncbi:hypothetical protein [Streptomyces sp. NPDC021224]|uniref:hypothetical protein n=1 Tax=unclassified Streptomyces TaxID=2593676 RepID=UPI00379C1FC2
MPDADPVPAAPADVPVARFRQRRRSRRIAAVVAAVSTALTVIPVLVVVPHSDPAPAMFTAGLAAGFCLVLLPHLCVARGTLRRHGPDLRYLTARTWTGTRTLDLRELRSVRTWKEVGRGGSETYLVLTDTAGIRLSFSDTRPGSVRLVRRYAIERPAREGGGDGPAARVTRLALADLNVRPLPLVLSGLRSTLSIARTCLLLLGPMTVAGTLITR